MSDILFDCKRCGTCCTGLFVHEMGVVSGLCLTEEEAKMFNPKLIVPYMAIGVNKPTTVIFYQLILADCPNLSEKNQCKIYDKRPLICRVFPIKADLSRVLQLPKCPQITKFGCKAGEMSPIIIEDDEIEKALMDIRIKLLMIRNECIEKGLRIWHYDLATKRWVISKDATP